MPIPTARYVCVAAGCKYEGQDRVVPAYHLGQGIYQRPAMYVKCECGTELMRRLD